MFKIFKMKWLVFFMGSTALLVFAYFFIFSKENTFVIENNIKEKQSDIKKKNNENSKIDVEEKKEDDKQDKQKIDKVNKADNKEKNVELKKTKENKLAENIKIINRKVSWGFTKKAKRKIDTIILHSSYNALGGDKYGVKELLVEYQQYGVSPHYLIDRQGHTFQLVDDKNIAWHAGVSSVPDGRNNVNDFSLGIEIMNDKIDSYNSAQYKAINRLLDYLQNKYKIKYILGHNEIAPNRKTDPWNFDWEKIDR